MREFDVVIGLGANLGDPRAAFVGALSSMRPWLRVSAVSDLYRTKPVGPPQPDFLNAAVRGTTRHTPHEILSLLLTIEQAAGRVRRERWGPRTLDLDVLWIAETIVDTPELSVPHPRLQERGFALLPLLDVAPEIADPTSGAPYAQLAAGLELGGIRRVDSDWYSPDLGGDNL
jgi:2-amino-4-hydroxy-6-hydroxymethyldihydropteridine diphosphokinase